MTSSQKVMDSDTISSTCPGFLGLKKDAERVRILIRGKMKNKTTSVSIILFFSALMMLVSCQQQKAEWKGTIEEVNGVTVVKNPKEPMYGEDVFRLEEELSIGEAEGREEYMFSPIRSIAVDEEERIYVLETRGALVKVFDKYGEYLRTIGRRGQGPGELNVPLTLSITNDNKIAVEDFMRGITIYSPEGEFIKSLSSARYFTVGAIADSWGNVIARTRIRDAERTGWELKRFDPNLEHPKTLMTITSLRSDSIEVFSPNLFWQAGIDGNVVVGYSKDYELQIFDSEGELIKKIIKDYDPVEISQNQIEERIKEIPSDRKLDIPKFYCAFQRFTVDDEGKIFVQTYEKTEGEEGFYYDVFDYEGRFFVKIPLKIGPRVWKKSKLYSVEEDEDGYQYIKRYKVTWKY